MNKVVFALGSNQSNRIQMLKKAIVELTDAGYPPVSQSSIIETLPYGVKNQSCFLNMVILTYTFENNPLKTLQTIKHIEKKLGRKQTYRWGPRTIDIDIIFWNRDIFQSPELTIPHTDLQNRDFVLLPLLEIIPNYVHPLLKTNIYTLWNVYKEKKHVTIK